MRNVDTKFREGQGRSDRASLDAMLDDIEAIDGSDPLVRGGQGRGAGDILRYVAIAFGCVAIGFMIAAGAAIVNGEIIVGIGAGLIAIVSASVAIAAITSTGEEDGYGS
jgi:hypothetical protein